MSGVPSKITDGSRVFEAEDGRSVAQNTQRINRCNVWYLLLLCRTYYMNPSPLELNTKGISRVSACEDISFFPKFGLNGIKLKAPNCLFFS
jgi:hypothetical protein